MLGDQLVTVLVISTFGTRHINYVPQFIQPPRARRFRPIGNRNRPAVQPPPEMNEAINLMADNFLSDLHDCQTKK